MRSLPDDATREHELICIPATTLGRDSPLWSAWSEAGVPFTVQDARRMLWQVSNTGMAAGMFKCAPSLQPLTDATAGCQNTPEFVEQLFSARTPVVLRGTPMNAWPIM